jgi:hypothetical protein
VHGDARLQFRLVAEEVALLYASASSTTLPESSIRRFFGIIELTESAASIQDVLAMKSLRASLQTSGAMAFDLGHGFVLSARHAADGGDEFIEFRSIART